MEEKLKKFENENIILKNQIEKENREHISRLE
jgi:hypothetical protein